jgi:hypothetical protein
MRKSRSRLRKNVALRSSPLEETNTESKLFNRVLLWLPYSGALAILLGFGYMSGLAAQFGYSATEILSDTKEFIFAGLYPIFTTFLRLFSWDFFKDLVISSISDKFVFLFGFIFLSAYFLFNILFRTKQKQTRTKNWAHSILPKLFARELTTTRFVVETLLVTVISVAYKLIVTIMLYGAFVVFTCILVIAFGIGYSEGVTFAKEEIIKPKACAPYVKKAGKDVEKTAYCARVVENGKEIARGRIIMENSERIFLYVKEITVNDKQENEVVRVPKSFPIHNAIIERVDTEDVKPQ